jgi:hypothetical protein
LPVISPLDGGSISARQRRPHDIDDEILHQYDYYAPASAADAFSIGFFVTGPMISQAGADRRLPA